MQTTFNNIVAWIKANTMLAILIAFAAVFVLFGKQVKKLFITTHRVKHRRPVAAARVNRRRHTRMLITPRKKPWQIKGSLAARRHMAEIRRKR